MIPAGYIYKSIANCTDDIGRPNIENIFSASGCISEDFTDWINYWKHNGYWLFDNPDIITKLAKDNDISLHEMTLFFYKFSDKEWNIEKKLWESYSPELSFGLNVHEPKNTTIVGYDIVSFSGHVDCECSPLSCNNLAESIPVNNRCLLDTYEQAVQLLESGKIDNSEPGPYRIIEVHLIEGT